jgi:phosphodiesterase/alkaline phosphatase D-like protein
MKLKDTRRSFIIKSLVAGVALFAASCKKIMQGVVMPLYSKLTLDIPEVSRDRVICFALYTVHRGIMKMTVQLYPLKEGEDRTLRLQVRKKGKWETVAREPVIEKGWTAHFRVEGWDSSRDTRYRALHGEKGRYEGVIKKDPVDKEAITVAAFTGNAIYKWAAGDIPVTDIVENIRRLKPDLLFFSGDQVYDHYWHYAYWLKFGRDFGDVIRNIPTVTIPDDHDVGQDNLWGCGGKKARDRTGDGGGYAAPLEYVKMVERAQTSHLPDPVDPEPVKRGLGVYFTRLSLGGIDFAILEDRKFKSAPPENLVPEQGDRPDHMVEPGYNPEDLDVKGARLLGERQLAFLKEWSADWEGCEMKSVLSQTIFASASHYSGERENRIYADLDSNGWPQAGRERALGEIRRGFATMIAGDTHLSTVIHHGIDEWEDAGVSFCVPSIANFYLRWWAPEKEGENRKPGEPEHLGRFRDGFGNRITMRAVANPSNEPGSEKPTTRAAGFGVVTFDKRKRAIRMESWPRNVNITASGARPYDGWPVTVRQEDNFGGTPAGYLPGIHTPGTENPVIQVMEEAENEILFTLRIKGSRWSPPVYREGTYTVKVSQGQKERVFTGLKPLAEKDRFFMTVPL